MQRDSISERFDRLDALLVTLRVPERPPATRPGDEDLEPLLAAARTLLPLREAAPSAAFTHTLEARLLSHAAALTSTGSSAAAAVEKGAGAAPSSMSFVGPGPVARPASGRDPARRLRPQPRARHLRFLWPAVAAILLLTLGTFTAAAAAGPGSPLYALHRLEQTARVALSINPADRVRLHLQYATEALAAADSAARSGNVAGYRDSLSTLRNEVDTATNELRLVAPGSEYDGLASSLSALRTRAIVELRTNLPLLSWSQRISTTDALANFGDIVPHVASATAIRLQTGGSANSANSPNSTTASANGVHTWRVQLSGTGFVPGARLLVNGQPAGTVLSVSGTTLVATYTAQDGQPPALLGIANPDQTAAQTAAVRLDMSDSSSGSPGPASTPGSGGQGGSGKDGHGTHSGTPTPAPRRG